MPTRQPRYRRGDRPVPPIRGGESRPGETPPAPAQPPATPPAEPPAAATPPEPDDPAKAQRVIDALRAEIRELKPKVQAGTAAAARLQELEDASKSDLERAQKKVADLEATVAQQAAERRTLLVRGEVAKHARRLDAVDEDDVYRLLDLDGIDPAKDDWPKDVERAVTKLLTDKPHLKRQAEGRPGVPPTPKANGQTASQRVDEAVDRFVSSAGFSRLG